MLFKNYLANSLIKNAQITKRTIINSMTENKKIPNVIFILGPPGAGKGTQSELILNHFEKQKIDHKYLCAGQLLREERKKENSKVGGQINVKEMRRSRIQKRRAQKTKGCIAFAIKG